MRTRIWLFSLTALIWIGCSAWGFFAHMRINRVAVYTLPSGMIKFYKGNINYISNHAVDADKRRYADTAEAPRHYFDAERYGKAPFDSIPHKWKDAVAKYTADTLKAYGILPWQIERSYYALVNAFKTRDSLKILKHSADIGHYIADAHVPLHTSINHNGQLSNQHGIHAFWESRLPELYASSYNLYVGKAQYIENPLKQAWAIIRNTNSMTDSVLYLERALNSGFPSDRKYSFSERKGLVIKQYSEEYSKQYHELMNKMVERQFRASISNVGNYWFSAWVDAGQPILSKLKRLETTPAEKRKTEQEENLYQQGRILGREE